MHENQGVLTIADGRFSITIDTRYAPLYFTRWSGPMTIPGLDELSAWYRKIGEQHLSRCERIAYVNHLGALSLSGGVRVRHHLYKSAGEIRRTAHGEVMVGGWHIISNRFVRRGLEGLRWATADERTDHFVAGWKEGIRGALATLDRYNPEAVAIDPDGYRFPETPGAPPSTIV